MERVKEVTETAAMVPPAMGLGALLDAGDGAIVSLVAGDTRLAAHKAVLSTRSPVFESMFSHGEQEATSGEVMISDVEGPVLREVLAYLYTQQPPQLPDMATQLLAAADRYGLSALKADCERQVGAQLTVETAASTAVLALTHSCSSLKRDAIDFIKAHTHQVMATKGWADAVINHPNSVVEFTRLIAETATESSTPSDGDDSTTNDTQPHSCRSQNPAAISPPKGPNESSAPVGTSVSDVWTLSGEEKNRRLIEAAREGALDEVMALLLAGAYVGARDEAWHKRTALHWAACSGNIDVVRCLVVSGAEVNARAGAQETPLHWAAYKDHQDVVRLLAASSADVDARDLTGWTPLHFAAYWGSAEAAAALLEAGATKCVTCSYGKTPLDHAREQNRQRLIEMLL